MFSSSRFNLEKSSVNYASEVGDFMSFFVFKIFSGDLYFGTLIMELFQICLVMGQTPVEWGDRDLLWTNGRLNSLAPRFVLRNWRWEETMYGASSQLSYLWDFEDQRGGGEVLRSSDMGGKETKGNLFYGGVDLLDTM